MLVQEIVEKFKKKNFGGGGVISTKTIFLLLRENLQDKFIIFILRRVSHGRGLGLGGGHKEGGLF